MAIKEAKQAGNFVSVKYGISNTQQIQGVLIGYTTKAVFVKNNRNLNIYVEKGGTLGGCGQNITINNNEDVKMYGNQVGIKKGSIIHLYNEDGRPAGTKQA